MTEFFKRNVRLILNIIVGKRLLNALLNGKHQVIIALDTGGTIAMHGEDLPTAFFTLELQIIGRGPDGCHQNMPLCPPRWPR